MDDYYSYDDFISKIKNGEYDQLLSEFDMTGILPEKCPNKMECETQLRKDLFSTYSPILKPTELEFMDVTFVELNLVLDKVLEISQTGEFMSIKVILNQKWTDPRLSWEKDDYKGVEYIHVPIDRLWQPDIILYNNIDGNFYPSLSDSWALVDYNGTVVWNPPSVYTSSCNVRVKQFPYDTQKCTMLFKSMTYEFPEIALIRTNDYVITDKMQPHIEWELTRAKVTEHLELFLCP